MILSLSDAQSLAILATAVGTVITTAGGLVLQILNFRASHQRDRKLAVVHDLVNGQSEALKKAIGDEAYNAGHAEGIIAEREDPHANAPGKRGKS